MINIKNMYYTMFHLNYFKNMKLIRNDIKLILLQKSIHTVLKTCSCGELNSSHIGSSVRIRGFLQYHRYGKFGVVRDSYGSTQILFEKALSKVVKSTTYESYVEVIGDVVRRPDEQIKVCQPTGEIEVIASDFKVLNAAKKDLPILNRDYNQPTESLSSTYRYLELRGGKLQRNLRLRSHVAKKMRDFLQDEKNFIEITTPTLSVATPGGAQEFIVPSRVPGHFYSLVQSPQIYKQLLMVGGFERYFQFAVCYRDEGSKPDRQPEFMQLDIESANMTALEAQHLLEEIIRKSWPEGFPPLPSKFPTMTYADAIRDYGVDKPDTRFDWKISDIDDSDSLKPYVIHDKDADDGDASAFVIPGGSKFLTTSHVSAWKESADKQYGGNFVDAFNVVDGALVSISGQALPKEVGASVRHRLGAAEGDSVVLSVGKRKKVKTLLGKIRLLAADVSENAGNVVRDSSRFDFLWVRDFPLFEWDEDRGAWTSCHHPFTAPVDEDIDLITSHPESVKSQHYDLVLNGCEVAGGSVRIHRADLQRDVLAVLGIEPRPLQFFLNALESGAPPHAGLALGFDRYMSILCGGSSIRDVMAFPKSAGGRCPMSDSPSPLCDQTRKLYHIR